MINKFLKALRECALGKETILNGIPNCKGQDRQWTNGKHSNQDCARALKKRQQFKNRSYKELKLIRQIYSFLR